MPIVQHPCCVKPGSKAKLASIDTRDDSLFPVGKQHGKELFKELANEIGELQELLYAEGKQKLLIVLQAMDSGGKDGTIRYVFREMDPQGVRVASFKKPTENELARDYLWRIHSQVPKKGECVIFNRSHYEDILAVRVREILPESVWSKRYEHIVNFEKMLVDEGTTIVKIFLHISNGEQKERLQARLDEPAKHWKFNPGDLDDRALWPKFMEAYEDVLTKTSSEHAPWFVIPADRKWYRNLVVAQIVIAAMRGMEMKFPPVNFDPNEIEIE
ncbi:MAG: polyphosphate kinase 2 family protein [Verrucomicrobiae bacterium]|nr:polyphosphate kinase 2 family protein [Verrucomicrobiae bacterium]